MNKENIKNINNYLIDNSISNILTFISFEDRGFIFLNEIKNINDYKINVLFNNDFHAKIQNNINEIKNNFISKNNFTFNNLSFYSNIKSFDKLNNIIKNLKDELKGNLLINITNFSHELLLVLLKLLNVYKINDKVHFIYHSADEYDSDVSNEDKWLTKGFKGIRSIIGYPGNLLPTKKNHLVIIFGFESERTISLIKNSTFDEISLGISDRINSVNQMNFEVHKLNYLKVKEYFPRINLFKVTLIDPIATKNIIDDYLLSYKSYNNMIIPMSNKVSTIGIGMYALQNTNVQLNYSEAEMYNVVNYSKASRNIYLWSYS